MKLIDVLLPVLGVSLAGPSIAAPTDSSDFKQRCLQFEPEKYVKHANRTRLDFLKRGANVTFPDYPKSCTPATPVILDEETCRIGLNISTSKRSSIKFEAWFPSNWNGRFMATGNGGIGGCIQYYDIAYGVSSGFAVVASNNGHDGQSLVQAANNTEVIKDFVYRALYTETVSGKALTKKFYKKDFNNSYYFGCSTGGRQGFAMAERYPELFDGIIAGAPAFDFNHLQSWSASFFPATGAANSSNFLTQEVWDNLIHKEVLRQCDNLDGVRDGIITDPTLCNFRPETLLCGKKDKAGKKGKRKDDDNSSKNVTCLTTKQVEIVKKIMSPLYGLDGELKYPAMQPGAETQASGVLWSGQDFIYSTDWFRYVVYNNSNWDPTTFNLSDVAAADEHNVEGAQTWPKTLEKFRSAGGKLLSFHGQQDGLISSFNTARFYDHLSVSMGMNSTELDNFFRFFRIPGMNHCSGGPGAVSLGQSGENGGGDVPFTREKSLLAALVAWVENGTAPDTITGTKYKDSDSKKGVEYTRKHCRYPLRSTFVGNGTDDDAEHNWKCLPAGSSL